MTSTGNDTKTILNVPHYSYEEIRKRKKTC